MSEYACAQRTGDKGEAEACIGGEKLRRRRFGRKEQRPEQQSGGGGIDMEVVDPDRRAATACEPHTAVQRPHPTLRCTRTSHATTPTTRRGTHSDGGGHHHKQQ